MTNRYEKAINAFNDYKQGKISAKQFADEWGFIAIDALHKADMESVDE